MAAPPRPGSRSGLGPPSGAQATMRPGTMMGSGRIPTAQRQGTVRGTRQGTAAQGPGVGVLTEVKISDRPTTTQGLSGMKTGSLGPKRQIYDKTYYIGELRRRSNELQKEIADMSEELQGIQQGNQLYNSLERRFESLVATVRSLEGDLADHNLASDKLRTDTRPEDVRHMYMIMKQQNDQERQEVDQIFLERRSHEEQIGEMEKEMMRIARQAEERLNELHPDQRREYEELREESSRLSSEVNDSRDELEQVTGRLNAVEARLRSDVLRTHYQQLSHLHRELNERLSGLQEEMAQFSLSIPEQRDLLLAKVKSDNAEIVDAERQISNMRMGIERLRSQIREVTQDAAEKRDDNDQQKYEMLFAKDQEMTQFIDGFPDLKAEEERKLQAKQDAIKTLLESISKAVALPSNTSPESHLRDMEDELDFKSRQLQNSESTHHRLEGELAKRETELEKIENLDAKITIELQQVESKMKQYEEEIVTRYDRIGDMREQGERHLQVLEVHRKQLEARHSAMVQQVNALRLQADAKKQQLADDEVAANLSALEQKIRQFGQTTHTLKSFIDAKLSESNYAAQQESCLSIADQLNKLAKEQVGKPFST